ncbi:hypothetical protein AB1Y20_002505 [Prymnesium parvum]|uniref:PDZ domain-containing protein n=1 Tax=Prymnesium parvum TaxID=97485 RepID=A0AB34JAL8_PRYPA
MSHCAVRPPHRPPSPAAALTAQPLASASGSSTRSLVVPSHAALVVHLMRIEGTFGVTLNPFNRVTAVNPRSAAAIAGVKVFDRVTHVNGRALEGRMSGAVGGLDAVSLTLERPSAAMHRMIAAKESPPYASSPLMIRGPALGLWRKSSQGEGIATS